MPSPAVRCGCSPVARFGKPSSKLAQSMDQHPADLPGMVDAIRARDHRRFAGKLDRKHLSLPQRASLLVFRGPNGAPGRVRD
jgi:hypothetical protein